MNLGQQMITSLNQERFDLGIWIANKLGLIVEREDHKRRLEELKQAFRKAGYRKLDAVQVLDDDDLSGIDSELENKLKPGEKKLLKKNL
jgi:RNase P protein component